MKDGFIKVAAATFELSLADCTANANRIIELIGKAQDDGASIIVFPELSLCGYTCGDLFFSDTLINSAKDAMIRVAKEFESSDTIIILGLPLLVNDKLYNCAAFCQKGQILGVVPKTIISPAEARYFSSTQSCDTVQIGDMLVPFGSDLLFRCSENLPSLKIGIDVGACALASVTPSASLCPSGATLIANPFAAPALVDSEEARINSLRELSARNMCGYIHAGAGDGESTTDGVFSGACAIFENGSILARRDGFAFGDELVISEIDLGLISAERRRKSYMLSEFDADLTEIFFELDKKDVSLTRNITTSPFLDEGADVDKRCESILTIQAKGLAQRIVKAYAKTVVIGISGGLDSTLALLVAARAMDVLGRPRTDIIGVTMPCFGTTARTKTNAEILCEELGVTLRCVDIGDAVKQHFRDIGQDENNTNVVFENAQARERTQVIMDIANMEGGFVVGTGDLSELALGWATYNGDHMSMYGVNGGVPKTLIRHIVKHSATAAKNDGKDALCAVLLDILDTPVSPELLPADKDGNIAQKTEDLVGPYELHDFYIYYMLRYGFSPDKLYRMAKHAFGGKYSDEELIKWLKNLVKRFFAQQFKRSCLPDGPKVFSVGVSPRGDLLMPSDATCAQWLRTVETLK